MPRVAINGTTRKRVIARPFTIPTKLPTRMPAKSAARAEKPALMPSAVITPVRAMVDPTERSIPPLMMIRVIPIAPIATITVCARTVRRFLGARYRSGAWVRIEKMATTNTRPSSGPSRFSHVWRKVEPDTNASCSTSATIPCVSSFRMPEFALSPESESKVECHTSESKTLCPRTPENPRDTLFQILVERRVKQSLNIGRVEIFTRDHCYARINSFLHRLAQEMFHHGAHAEVTHVERVLHYNPVQLICMHSVDKRLAGVKTDENYFAGFADILQRQQHSGRR